MMHLHKWEKWSECTQAYSKAVQWRRCKTCGEIVERTVTTVLGGSSAKFINDAIAAVKEVQR